MKIRYPILLVALAFWGFSTVAVGHSCKKFEHQDGSHCTVDPDPPVTEVPDVYTAALIAGGFRFGPVEITPNNRDTGYTSTKSLDMTRPSDKSDPLDALAWDKVFLSCFDVLGDKTIPGVTVGTDWGITQGGKKNSDTARNIRIVFRTVVADGFEEVDLWISLFNWADFPRSDFFPVRGETIVYPLVTVKVYGDDIGNHTSCNPGEFLFEPLPDTRLEICHKYEDGTGC